MARTSSNRVRPRETTKVRDLPAMEC
jgi:hypothetical protein